MYIIVYTYIHIITYVYQGFIRCHHWKHFFGLQEFLSGMEGWSFHHFHQISLVRPSRQNPWSIFDSPLRVEMGLWERLLGFCKAYVSPLSFLYASAAFKVLHTSWYSLWRWGNQSLLGLFENKSGWIRVNSHVNSHPSRRVSRARLFWRNIMGCCAAPDWGQRSLWGCCTLLCCASLGAFEALAFSAVLVGRRTSPRCWRGHQVGEMEENQTWQWATLDHVYGSRLRSSKNNSIVPDILWGFYCWNLGPSIRSVPRIWPSQKPSAGEPSSLVSGVQVAASNDSNGLQGNYMKLLHNYWTCTL